ncbi:MAG TPA: serine/threonine-protein kinase [Kofleriaceae bacterium]|nr:serine/threonine-protein kinase [Kofleriaceae bacterium]
MLATRLPSDMLAPGTHLGRYELLERIAVGGMAELYLARATGIQGFQKLVALKRMLPQYAANDDFVTMFLDEARLAATLQHANLAQVYDIGQCAQGLFFTMEFIHGKDARNLLQDRCRVGEPVPLIHAISIVSGAAAGLHAAHEKVGFDGQPLGVVHRDVSPANVLVSFDGCVKVIDFGVAKAARQQNETRVGTLKGKIAYMAPEHCLGDLVDRRADVFGLGIMLYELTTNQRLFQGENEFAIMKRIVGDDAPPPSHVVPGYPHELERITLKALARDPRQRYQTAQALQIDLETFLRDRGEVVSAVRLGQYMRTVFSAELDAWRRTLAAFEDDAPVIELVYEPLAEVTVDVPANAVEREDDRLSVDTGMFLNTLVPECPPLSGEHAPGVGRAWRAARALAVMTVALALMVLPGWQVLRVTGETIELPASVEAPAQATTIAPLATGVTLSASIPVAPAAPLQPDPPKVSEPARDVRNADGPRSRRAVGNADRRTRKRPASTARRWDPDSALPP